MDNRISEFLKTLEENLQGLSAEESKNALLYYNEYLNDAFDSGKNLDEVIDQLGKPQDIGAMIKAEESFNRAQKKPGLRNFNKAMKNAFLGVSTPIGYFIRGLFLLVVYSALAIFLGGAVISLVGSIIGLSALLYEMFKIPSQFFMERLGTLGMALFVLSLLFLLSMGLFRISQWLIRLASRVIRKMLRNKVNQEAYEASTQEKGKTKDRLVVGISLGVLVLSLILTFSSGLPVKLFNIFDSAKPGNIKAVVSEFNASDVKNIVIKTAHSCIKVVNDSTRQDKVVITYEQPDWLNGQAAVKDGKVTFTETSNGRLPLFDLVSLHESRTEVTLYLPEGLDISDIQLESKGGFISIIDTVQNISAKTYTGKITLDVSKTSIPYNLVAKTEVGILDADSVYPNSKDYPEISFNQQNAVKTFRLSSNRGDITIKQQK